MEWAALGPRLASTQPGSFFSKGLPALQGSDCMTLIVSSEELLLILYTKQVRQIYSAAVFLHNPNSMNKSNADGGALQP